MLKLKFFINESVIYTNILFMNIFSALKGGAGIRAQSACRNLNSLKKLFRGWGKYG
jgi:hypothetical protein